MKIIIGNNNSSDSENLLNIYPHKKNKLIQLIIKVPIDPKKIILNVYIKLLLFFLPRYSASSLFPELPKKFVIKMVIKRQKLIVTLISPRVFGPKNRATRKLNIEGVNPMKSKDIPV